MLEDSPQQLPPSEQQSVQDNADVFFVSLSYKGTTYDVPVQADDEVASIFTFVREALEFPSENCKLLFRGKVLRPEGPPVTIAEAGLAAGSKVMLVASSARDISFVQNSRADPLVKGFAEEERDEQGRRKRARAAAVSAWGTKQHQEYRFLSIKAEFKYAEPPPFEAERLLQRLATDPGIIDIMVSRKFQVGILTEMSPVEAQDRMAKRGTPNMDLLGYNQNSGEMIVLRLRTDNLKGFRPYHDLINTLIHELTHNVWGPHDHNFWQLYGELKAQYMRFHKFWSHGGRAADSGAVQFQGFDLPDDQQPAGNFGHTLGGASGSDARPGSAQPQRSLVAAAAEARLAATAVAAPEAAADGGAVGLLPLPNLFASNGAWLMVCPCGQIHDPAGCQLQPQGAAAPSAAGASSAIEEASAENAAEAASAEASADDGPQAAAADAEAAVEAGAEASAGASAEAGAEANVEAGAEAGAEAAPQGSAEVGAEALVEVTATEQAPAVMDVCGSFEATQASFRTGTRTEAAAGTSSLEEGPVDEVAALTLEPTAPVEPPNTAAASSSQTVKAPAVELADGSANSLCNPFRIEDLASQGLDGAAVWLERFSKELHNFYTRSQQPVARTAVELLLRVVKNIVERPHEPKYRRIRADNPRVRTGLLSAGEEVEKLMAMLGFQATTEAGDRVFVLRDASFDCARLLLGRELLERELGSEAVAVQ